MPVQFGPFKQATPQDGGLGFESNVSINQFINMVKGTGEKPDSVLKQLESQGYEVEGANAARRLSAEDHIKQKKEIDEVEESSAVEPGPKFKGYVDLLQGQDNAFAGVVASIPKTIGNITKLFNKEKGENINDYVNKAAEFLGRDTESKEFKGGEFGGDIAQLFIPQIAVAKLAKVQKISELLPLIQKYPKLAGALEKVSETTFRAWKDKGFWRKSAEVLSEGALATQGMDIIHEGEFATPFETFVGALSAGALMAPVAAFRGAKSLFTKASDETVDAAQQIFLDKAQEMVEQTDKYLKKITNYDSPLNNVKNTLVTQLNKVVEPMKKGVGKEIGNIRKRFKTIGYKTNTILDDLNDTFNEMGIRLKVQRNEKGKLVIDGALEKEERAAVRDLVRFFDETLKDPAVKGKLAAADEINQYLKAHLSKMVSSGKIKKAGAAFSAFGAKLGNKIDDVISDIPGLADEYAASKGLYGKYKALLDATGKGDKQATNLIKKGLKGDEEARKFFEELAEVEGGQNLLFEAELARFIQYIMRDKAGIVKSLGDQFYPSVPGLMETGIKIGANKLFDPILEILKKTKGWKEPMKAGASRILGDITRKGTSAAISQIEEQPDNGLTEDNRITNELVDRGEIPEE